MPFCAKETPFKGRIMEDAMLKDNEDSRLRQYIRAIPFLGDWLDPQDSVAVLRMSGVIADSSMMRRAGINFKKFDAAIDAAFKVKRLRALVLIINSPGGAPAQCSLLSAKIRNMAKDKNIPVYAFIEDVAASGGYWLACIGDEIYAQETSIVGSIGVISASFGLDAFIRKHDVARRVYTSGRDKSFLDPFMPEKADDVSRLKALQEQMHESFKEWVRSRRGEKLKGDESELMEGAFWTGAEAADKGLIDGIGDLHAVLKDRFGDKIKLVDCSPEKKSLLATLLPLGGGEAVLDPGALLEVAEERSAWNRFGL